MVQKWRATKAIFNKWYLINGSRRLMTLKKGPTGALENRVRFFRTRTTAIKEARRLNNGGKMRKQDS